MAPILQKKVLTQFLFGLKMDGYLFLGPSENPVPIAENLELVDKKWKIFRNRQQKKIVSFDAFSMPVMRHPAPLTEKFLLNETSVPPVSLIEAINIALSTETGALILCVDDNNTVVKTYGDTTKFLHQKNFTTNLSELLPGPLSIAFNTASHTAIRTGKKTSLDGIEIKYGKSTVNVCLTVIPLKFKKKEKLFLLVSLSESSPSVTAKKKKRLFSVHAAMDQYTKNLEAEVAELKETLKGIYQQLEISHENMQAYNEEILSSNEEMQSTNEEMQSVNEELHTINSEYQLKNKELEEVNSDLDNYFRSNINGQLFVNTELVLMKFSPGTVKQINLLPTDIGRPLSNISTNIKFETLTDDIKKVLSKGDVITKEIETKDGQWYQVMTMPYLQQPDNKINGAIITFNDITELKKAQSNAERRNKILERINNDLDNFVLTASHDLLAPLTNIETSIAVMNNLKVIGPELNEYLTVINSSVKKFRSLIGDIATVAKVENSMLVLEMVDIDEVLDNVLWSLGDKLKSSKAVINRRLNVKRILFTKNNLRSVLFNLISNSLKYSGDTTPEINIDTNWENHHVVLSVSDNGIGISKKDNARIFAMYGRLQNEIEGQGIGLYLVKKIVDAAEGQVVVESEEGKGSKFTIHFKG
jgi:two-component system CheB/CheR fusion protein